MTDIIAQALAACPVEWDRESAIGFQEHCRLVWNDGWRWQSHCPKLGTHTLCTISYDDVERDSLMEKAWREKLTEQGVEVLFLGGVYRIKYGSQGYWDGQGWSWSAFNEEYFSTYIEALAKAIVAVFGEKDGD